MDRLPGHRRGRERAGAAWAGRPGAAALGGGDGGEEARALASVSRSSRSGTESATTPALAWQ